MDLWWQKNNTNSVDNSVDNENFAVLIAMLMINHPYNKKTEKNRNRIFTG